MIKRLRLNHNYDVGPPVFCALFQSSDSLRQITACGIRHQRSVNQTEGQMKLISSDPSRKLFLVLSEVSLAGAESHRVQWISAWLIQCWPALCYSPDHGLGGASLVLILGLSTSQH